jgi:hypothetical protein
LKKVFQSNNIVSYHKTCEREVNDNEISDLIEMSKLIVLAITNNFVKTDRFKKALESIQLNRKPVIFLLMENIDKSLINNEHLFNFNQMNMIEYYSNGTTSEMCYRLLYLYISVFCKLYVLKHENDKVKINVEVFKILSTSIESSQVKHDNYVIEKNCFNTLSWYCIFDDYENNQILFIDSSSTIFIYIYNRNTFQFIKNVLLDTTDMRIIGVCFNKYLNKFCLLDQKMIVLLNKDLTHARDVLTNISEKNVIKSIFYDQYRQKIYVTSYVEFLKIHVFDKNVDFQETILLEKELKKDFVDILFCKESFFVYFFRTISVYDFYFKLKTTIEVSFRIRNLFIDLKVKNYVYLLDTDHLLRVFNLNGFKIYANFKYDILCFPIHLHREIAIINNNLVFFNEVYNKGISVHAIHFNVSNGFIKSYACKLDTFQTHLLRNAYLLPCGNLACLECILQNYNIYKNSFFCIAETCQNEHMKLNTEIKKSFIIEDNLEDIVSIQMKMIEEIRECKVLSFILVKFLNDYIFFKQVRICVVLKIVSNLLNQKSI